MESSTCCYKIGTKNLAGSETLDTAKPDSIPNYVYLAPTSLN
jgi:hypothetical protein